MRGRYRVVIYFLVLIFGLIFINQRAEATEATIVRVGYYSSTSFQEGAAAGERKSGYSYEYLRKIAQYCGWTYEYVYGDWAELLEKLKNGEIDVMAGVSYTEERTAYLAFPNEQMGEERYYIYANRQDSSISSSNIESLKGKRVGAIVNNLMSEYLRQWADDNGIDIEIIYYNSFAQRDTAFAEGEVDAIVSTDNNVSMDTNLLPIAKIGAEPYYLSVSKQRKELLAVLNDTLSRINEDEPFFLENLQLDYFVKNSVSSQITSEEREWLDEHQNIRIGYLEEYLPYCDTDEKGQLTGLLQDVMSEIHKTLKIDDAIQFQYTGYAEYEDMIQDLQAGELDVVFPVNGDSYICEQNNMFQSNPVVTAGMYLIYKGAYEKLGTGTFAINSKNALHYQYALRYYPNAKFVFCDSIEGCLAAVADGKADYTIINGLRFNHLLVGEGYDALKAVQLMNLDERCFGVKRTDSALLLLLNRGIKLIGSEFGLNASYRYMGTEEDGFLTLLSKHPEIIFGIVIFIFIIIIYTIARGNHRMKQHLLEKEEYQKKLEQSRANLEENNEIIAKAGYGIWKIALVDGGPNEMFANDELQRIFGIYGKNLSRTELYEYYHSRLVGGGSIEEINNDYRQMEQGKLKSRLLVWNHPEKGNIYLRAGGTAHDKYSSKFQISGYCGDVTESKNTEDKINAQLEAALKQAESANKSKTSFLFNMSHDIRTPMNAIIGFANMIEKSAGDEKKVLNYIGKVKSAGDVMLSLVNNVLEMARIENGKVELDEAPGNLRDTWKAIYDIFESQMQLKDITYEQHIDVVHENVYYDVTKVREIIINLISNAYKYTPSGGKVTITYTELPEDRAGYATYRMIVEDTGIGMSSEFVEHIFDEFAREKNSTESKIEGTGLGMSIVKKLVELMDGTISVESEPGQGSRFTMIISHRIAEETVLSKQSENLQPEGDNLQGRRILLAEDNELNAEIATALLEEVGVVIECVTDGAECVERVTEKDAGYYDLILMDIQMPKMDGYTATEKIRELPDSGKSGIPIIAMTANAFEEDRKNAYAVGMNGHLPKPIVAKDLYAMVAKMMQRV